MTVGQQLKQFQQEHLLQFASDLPDEQLARLQQQIAAIDFAQLDRLCSENEQAVDWAALAARAEPPNAIRLDQANTELSQPDAIGAGEQALRSGKIAAILVAGGQGTRLGFDKPKGLFPIGPVSNRTLFQMHCDRLLAVMNRYGKSIPLFVMTSPATDQATREYFATNDNCGLSAQQIHIFCQGTMPAVDAKTGKVLLSAPDSIALSPDGHGGLVAALDNEGCLATARELGIEHFFYAQVDNPLAQLCDPELIGYHLKSESEMTTQVVKKRFAKEKVGNVVTIDGKTQIIEYSDLPDEIAEQKTASGDLKFWAGNIAIHLFSRMFLEARVADSTGLVFHHAHKAVPYVASDGSMVHPTEPNAIKFERFVFDLLPLAERAIVVEADASKVFAPVKNANGAAVDTPASSKAALLALHHQWLESAGASIEPDVKVEIHPAWALDARDVRRQLSDHVVFSTDTFLR